MMMIRSGTSPPSNWRQQHQCHQPRAVMKVVVVIAVAITVLLQCLGAQSFIITTTTTRTTTTTTSPLPPPSTRPLTVTYSSRGGGGGGGSFKRSNPSSSFRPRKQPSDRGGSGDSNDPDKIRLQKVLAHAGVSSRRRAEELIKAGRVTVNGVRVQEMGLKVNPVSDKVCVDGKRIVPRLSNEVLWVVINKPRGVITSMEDEKGRKCVSDLVPLAKERRLLPVGRLDRDSGGLLLLTNDNEAINYLTHPAFGHVKTYKVVVKGAPAEHVYQSIAQGVLLPGEKRATLPIDIEFLDYFQDKRETVLRLTVKEGKNRMIRRLFEYFGHEVKYLTRMSFGSIRLGELKPGDWRKLTTAELYRLRGAINAYKKKAQMVKKKKLKALAEKEGKAVPVSKKATTSRTSSPPSPNVGTVLPGGRGFGAGVSSSAGSSTRSRASSDEDGEGWEEDDDDYEYDSDDDYNYPDDDDDDDEEEEEEWE